MTRQNNFNGWLETFIEEKEINTARVFEFIENGEWNYMPLEVVLEFIQNIPEDQQATIKDTIVKIDFHNGDVYHYFEYLAKGIAIAAT